VKGRSGRLMKGLLRIPDKEIAQCKVRGINDNRLCRPWLAGTTRIVLADKTSSTGVSSLRISHDVVAS
jgi:hypothetical protein